MNLNSFKKLHQSIVPLINQTKINKVFVKGKNVISIFNKFQNQKKEEFCITNLKLLN